MAADNRRDPESQKPTLQIVTDPQRALARAIVDEFWPRIRTEISASVKREVANAVLEVRQDIADLKAWRERHEAMCALAQPPSTPPVAPSLPPMRNAMNTGRFEANLKVLEDALKQERELRTQYEMTKLVSENAELKEARRWNIRTAIETGLKAIGAVAAVVLAYLAGMAFSRK